MSSAALQIVVRPSPLRETEHLRRRVRGLDRRAVVARLPPQLVIGRGPGMHVAMGAVPQRWLVSELVEADASAGRRPVEALELLDPVAPERGVDLHSVPARLAGHEPAARLLAIAALSVVRIERRLVREHGSRKTARKRVVGLTVLGDP